VARQILSPIDLRTAEQRRGLSSSQRNLQAITGILKTIGQGEQIRRERQQLDRVATAIANGASTIEAINAAASQPAEFSGGLRGILQKVAGGFQPPSTGGVRQSIQQAIIGQGVRRATEPPPLLSREEERDKAIFGTKKRAGEGIQPFEQTKPEKARNRDIKILTDKDKQGVVKATDVQKNSARRRLRKNPSIQDVLPGKTDYSDNLTDKPKVKVKGATFDKAFGEEAYKLALKEAMDEGLAEGATEASVEADFNAWWDKTAAAGSKGQPGFGVFVIPRSEFQDLPQRQDLLQRGEPVKPSILPPAEKGKIKPTPLAAQTRNPGEAIDEFLKRTSK